MNCLNAVFWDYPKFTKESYLKNCLKENKRWEIYKWILCRFLEHGRVIDVFKYYLRSCKLVELEAGSEKRFKITTPTEEQVKLTRVLADENLLDENKVQYL